MTLDKYLINGGRNHPLVEDGLCLDLHKLQRIRCTLKVFPSTEMPLGDKKPTSWCPLGHSGLLRGQSLPVSPFVAEGDFSEQSKTKASM